MRITFSLLAAALVGALAFTTTASQAQTPPEEAVPEPIMEAEDDQSPAFTMSM